MWNALKPAAIRAVRTFAQVWLGVYLAGVSGAPALRDLADLSLIESATAAAVVAVLTLAHNLREDVGGVKLGPKG